MSVSSRADVIALWLLTAIVFVSVIVHFENYITKVHQFGDNPGYVGIASGIENRDFRGITIKQFWGLSYAIALLSILTRLSNYTSLLIVCCCSSLISVWFAYKLWDARVAGLFAVLNFDWLQCSFLGGSEPLFVALIFGAFLAIRHDKWQRGALLASFATIVRPLGILALLAFGITLFLRRDYRRVFIAIAISSTIGLLYVLSLRWFVGDALATVHSYQSPDRALFGIPFHAIIEGTLKNHPPITNLALNYGWIIFVIAGLVALLTSTATAQFRRTHTTEIIFACGYLLAIVCYNYPYWALGNFPRFAIPVLPFVLLGCERFIPTSRAFFYGLAVVSSILAGASAVGIRNIIPGLP